MTRSDHNNYFEVIAAVELYREYIGWYYQYRSSLAGDDVLLFMDEVSAGYREAKLAFQQLHGSDRDLVAAITRGWIDDEAFATFGM